jgi:hypothetical protein
MRPSAADYCEGRPMTPLLYRVGQFCARRRLLVLGVWLVLAVGLGV